MPFNTLLLEHSSPQVCNSKTPCFSPRNCRCATYVRQKHVIYHLLTFPQYKALSFPCYVVVVEMCNTKMSITKQSRKISRLLLWFPTQERVNIKFRPHGTNTHGFYYEGQCRDVLPCRSQWAMCAMQVNSNVLGEKNKIKWNKISGVWHWRLCTVSARLKSSLCFREMLSRISCFCLRTFCLNTLSHILKTL